MAIAFDLVGQQWQRKIIVVGAAAVGLAVLMAMQPASPEDGTWHEMVERSGIVFILIGILGRTWCAMYIGGNKLNRLVTEGPYSITRNPLYVFSAIAAFGLGAQLGSAVFALVCAAATIAIFALVISHEERALADRFPAEFARYRARVPRFAPNFRSWQEADTLLVRPALVRRTFFDATLFLLAAPALKGLESLRDAAHFDPLFRLY
jgi:protein-S-isoprenylcysteine O-methyltransferase Ste14